MAKSDMLVRLQADTKNYDANLAKASRTLEQFKQNNLSLGGIMKQSTTALTGMAASVISVTAAIGAAKKVIGDMVSINMQFEQSSSNLAAVMGKSRDEITALTDQAKQLGATTQYTANQILELQANLARLGFNENEIKNSTTAVQAMATAMGADLGEAANLAGSALRGFGLQATEMDRVASVLSVGTTKSALSFEKLATALPIVQTAAAKTGFTIEDTVAMLGKLTDNGINAASAATQLRKILNDSTTAGTKLANALGGPVKSFDELVVALDKANKAGQNHADSVTLVNSKNATALDILRDMAAQRTVEIDGVQKQTSALQDLRDSITDCSDGMRAMQDEQLNTLQGSITILNSAWEGLMLTFSESNGAIKTVTDSLTKLLTAYTNWRKRNQGGDAAISTYELGITDEQKKNATSQINRQRSQGVSDEDIAKAAESRKAGYEKERDAMKSLLDQWEKAGKQGWGSKAVQDLMDDVEAQFGKMEGAPYKWAEEMYKRIAGKNDRIAVEDFIIGSVTPAETSKKTAEDDGEDKSKARLKVLKAKYEEQEKAQIASLDRMAMNEADYEAEVYKIKRETLQKIADLYQDETAEKARANAAISQLDIQYQGTQYRRGLRADREAERAMKSVVSLTFSDEGISNLGKQIKEKLESAGFGTGEYLLSAEQLVDFNNLQTLLSFALKNGLKADMEWFNSLFEDIKIGADVDTSTWQALVEHINALIDGTELNPFKVKVETGGVETATKDVGKLSNEWVEAAHAVGQFGSALQSVEDPTAKIAGIIAQAIASVAAGAGSAIAQAGNGSAGGPWGWVAFAISATATMISTIAAIKSVTSSKGYAQGGIVGGNSYSGDQVVARLNSGEGVLTRVGLDSAARMMSAFDSQVGGGSTSTPFVTGEKIILGVNNFLGRSGQGEIVTTSMLRRAGVNI